MYKQCLLSLPYPEIKVERPNRKYAVLLAQFISGANSELTSISDYAFQSIITEATDQSLSDILECISITEMKHFRIIAKTIQKLGSTPVFWHANKHGKKQFWNTGFVDYRCDVREFLKENIFNEKKAIINYKNALLQINDTYIRQIIERIILDEEHHITLFSSMLR